MWIWQGGIDARVAGVMDLARGNVTSPPVFRPPPLHKWRGGIDARVAGVCGFGEGELTLALRALWIWRGGIDARVAGVMDLARGG